MAANRAMKETELDQRLGAIAARVSNCTHVADIGADHGLLACYLLEHNARMRMTVSDVSAPSLEKARALLSYKGYTQRVRFCVADGLDALDEAADAIVIAGMGAKTIREILTAGREKIGQARLILQPNLDLPRLRAYLWKAGFEITDEEAVCAAGRYYVLIEAKITLPDCKEPLEARKAFLGVHLPQKRDEGTHAYYAWQAGVRRGELARLDALNVHTPHAKERRDELQKELLWLGEVL